MKRLIYPIAMSVLLACNTWQSEENPVSTDSSNIIRETDTVYLVRNSEITPANSYSDLFLDTLNVEQFIQQRKISGLEAQKIRSFYNFRNGQFAWFNTTGFTEQARGFWNLRDALRGDSTDKALEKKMDTLLNMDTLHVSRFDTSIANTELALTHAFLRFYHSNRNMVQFVNLPAEKFIPVKKENEISLTDTLLNRQPDSSLTRSVSTQYKLLKQKLQGYKSLAMQGGWEKLNIRSRQFKKNGSYAEIPSLKKRLQITGEYNSTDTSKIFNDSLAVAIKKYQLRHGLDTTGKISDTLIVSMNVPVEERIRQLIINLNRVQWMLPENDSRYIQVNIPELMLTVYENGAKLFDMPVVVGKEGTNTMMLSGYLNQVVFSPYWNIPASIVQKEILPAMKADPDYLKKNKMEIIGRNDSLPVIRQLPGADNGLGGVKFLFPNRYDIYFHDTKAREVFQMKDRALSHGCIRLADAEKMANYLLRDVGGWTPGKINTAMKSGKEQYVKIKRPVPVSITYLTAWVDESGELQFRNDIYGHDRKITPMMFEVSSSTIAHRSGDTASSKAPR
jgi:murein L,D-transpeptidase YcbB/YkuD